MAMADETKQKDRQDSEPLEANMVAGDAPSMESRESAPDALVGDQAAALHDNTSSAAQSPHAAKVFSDLEVPEPWLSSDVLRESGVLLGGATALLYLTSHVLGEYYLDFFNVSMGFQGVGIGNLAMLPIPGVLVLCALSWWMYALLSKSKLWAFGLGFFLSSAISGATLVVAYRVTGGASGGDWIVASLGPFSWCSVYMWRGNATKHLFKFENAPLSMGRQIEAIPESILGTSERGRLLRFLEYISSRAKWIRIRLMLLSMYVTMVVVIPVTAILLATLTTYTQGQIPTPPGVPARIPVYWVGDRSVYLTWGDGKCVIHVQIANSEISQHECPRRIVDLLERR